MRYTGGTKAGTGLDSAFLDAVAVNPPSIPVASETLKRLQENRCSAERKAATK